MLIATMVNRQSLSLRERALVAAIVEGCTNRQIARKFGLNEQTVKNQLTVLFEKVGVSSRLELAMYAVKHHIHTSATE